MRITALSLIAALGLMGCTACGIAGPKSEAPAGSSPYCACFTDPTGNWRCTDPFVQAPDGVKGVADLVAAWAPVIATSAGHPEVAAILSHVKIVACTAEVTT